MDGNEPTVNSSRYTNPFSLPKGGTVKAYAVTADGTRSSEVVTVGFDIAPAKWRIVSPRSPSAENAIDNNPNTLAILKRTDPLVVDLGEKLHLKGFYYLPLSSETAANISRYNLYVSIDGKEWLMVKENASFDNIRNNPIRQNVLFEVQVKAKYLKMEPIQLSIKQDEYAVMEFGVITR
jgi:alpha-L-fucosidase